MNGYGKMNSMEEIMRKIIKVLIMIVAMGILFTACGKKDTDKTNKVTEDTSLSDILTAGKLTLGLDDSLPPMGFLNDDQEIVGFDIDVAREVCKRMGIELILQPISWVAKEQELNTKNIDCIWNGFTLNDKRKEDNQLSIPYMKNTQVAIVMGDSPMRTLEDLAGKTIVIQNGSTAEEALAQDQKFKDSLKEVITVEDNVKALMDLDVAGSDAVVMDEVVARYYMEKDPSKYHVLEQTLADEEYVVGFRKGEIALCQEVEKYLREMKADGTLAKISMDWFGEDLTTVE